MSCLMAAPLTFAQVAWGVNGIVQMLIALIILGAIWYIFTQVVTLPPKVMMILNVIIGVVAAVIAIRFLASFLF